MLAISYCYYLFSECVFCKSAFRIILVFSLISNQSYAFEAPLHILKKFNNSQTVDLIVEYDDKTIEKTAKTMRSKKARSIDDTEIIRFKRKEYKALKDKVDKQYIDNDISDLKNYSDLPIKYKRFKSEKALKNFLVSSSVKAVYENTLLQRVLTESLPLINQPNLSLPSAIGAGTTVAVLDDGIDFTHPAFGSCISPNVPASSCKVVAYQEFSNIPSTFNVHGTNVSAIVLGVAPATKIAMLNVFSTEGAFATDIIDAINWSIVNKATYNIEAMNLSLGDTSRNASYCNFGWFTTPFQNARNAGISIVVASGNSAFSDGIAAPACAPEAISVGAVYDANVGGFSFGVCTDTTSSANQVACFSNSANILTMLAPGGAITAAGITQFGTSQAAPHVAGALAVLRALYPNENLNQIQSRLINSGIPVLDIRNNITKPRLNLLASGRPSNDAFANRITLTGASGSTTGQSAFASKEVSEPNHAGNLGGASIWWKWVANTNGQLSITTSGSAFDTLLAVYEGPTISSLLPVASNDNELVSGTTSRVFLNAIAGKEYQIAIDGSNGNKGSISLAWALNTSPSANLSLSLSGSNSVQLGQATNYNFTINNLGPQAATNARVVFNIPLGASLVTIPTGCTLSADVLTCLSPVILNGGNQVFTIQLIWNTLSTPVILSATASSEVADTVSANNSSTLQVRLDTNSGGGSNPGVSQDGDVPTLPEWAGIFLMLTLIWQNFKVHKQRV